jgi:hypothetical protein
MEAKLTCYGPSHGPENEVRAAKAFPADTPDLLAQRIPALASAQPAVLLVLFAAFADFSQPNAARLRMREIAAYRYPVFVSRYFFHHLFLRPPPSFR